MLLFGRIQFYKTIRSETIEGADTLADSALARLLPLCDHTKQRSNLYLIPLINIGSKQRISSRLCRTARQLEQQQRVGQYLQYTTIRPTCYVEQIEEEQLSSAHAHTHTLVSVRHLFC